MPIRAVALVSAMFLCLWGMAARAEAVRFVTIDTAPWASLERQSGMALGVFPDIIRELERRTGIPIRMELQPFARIPKELESLRQDCTILVWNDQWASFMVQGEFVSSHLIGVIARNGVKLQSYDDLSGLSVSVLRGLSLGERFDTDASIHRQYDTDYVQGLNKLAHGRLDAVAGALPTIAHLAQQNGLGGHLGDRLTLTELTLRFQCAKGSARRDIMPAINEAILAMTADGTLESIKTRWDYH
jgi:polar amino acid transport system substrate-binding protein